LCTFALRRKVFDKIGLHREYFETSSDIDFQLRLGEACRVGFVPDNIYFYRVHDSSTTHTQGNRLRVFLEDTAREFQRQRQASGVDALQSGTPPTPPEFHGDAPNAAGSQIQGILLGRAWRHLADGQRRLAASTALRAVAADPRSAGTWRSAMVLFVRLLPFGSRRA
jgi:hypothetical protein